jgi:2',3'-cyclic-nucleotide 2'-phosphodiesterase (5'-nucleotidase family)
MTRIFRTAITVLVILASLGASAAQRGASVEAHLPSQAAADVLREAAGSDGAFLAAGLVKESFNRENLASLLQYPEDEVVVLALKGAQIRQAFERSISLYPQQNTSFLQVSGFEIVFDPSASPGSRIKRVTAGGSALDESRTYNVAMPSSLGRGGLGYFKIWDKTKIVSTLPNTTVEKVLAEKKMAETAPRWVAER